EGWVIAARQPKLTPGGQHATGGERAVGRDLRATPVALCDHSGVREVPVGAADGAGRRVLLVGELPDAWQLRAGRKFAGDDARGDFAADVQVAGHRVLILIGSACSRSATGGRSGRLSF